MMLIASVLMITGCGNKECNCNNEVNITFIASSSGKDESDLKCYESKDVGLNNQIFGLLKNMQLCVVFMILKQENYF